MLSSTRSVSWNVRTRTVSSPTLRNTTVVSARTTSSTWYTAAKLLSTRRKLSAWLASDSANTPGVESAFIPAKKWSDATNGSDGPPTANPIPR